MGWLPNGLTLFRVITIPVMIWLLLWDGDWSNQACALVFGAAGFSDIFDGWLARRYQTGTQLGIFLDLVGDKLLVTALLFTFVEMAWIPGWYAAVVVAREFMVMGLRAYAGAQGVAVAAGPLGKQKMMWQYIAFNALMWERSAMAWQLLFVALVLTVASGAHYFVAIWRGIQARPVPAVPETI